MDENDIYIKIQDELMTFMREEAQALEYPDVQSKLAGFASQCWCRLPEDEPETEEEVLENFFYLSGWLESRIQLANEGPFKKKAGGIPLAKVFRLVPQ